MTLGFSTLGLSYVEMTRVDAKIFIANPETDFSKIRIENETLKAKMVAFLFDNDLIDHIGTKAYDPLALFVNYYKQFGPLYQLIDLNNDKVPELIFNGYPGEEREKEQLQIFTTIKGELVSVYNEIGHLLAYKVQPNTKEFLLYHHQYPCCENASHNLNRLRLVNNKMKLLKRYFLGRDTEMLGDFFPKTSTFTGDFYQTKSKISLHWSPEIIENGAWPRRTDKNIIAYYADSTAYSVLAKKGKWRFVIMHGIPVIEENRVINPANFSETWIYGWIK
ncbi:hypothetical protein [Fluviicola taffensis]|uniref:Uncharacterized protein n=1 Tax=Fluviicola taffensis (strain DSM 16823 / NCIMB 13979 / RW262) TaxID=755732 RepID=F2IA71_FLUTR|nr:hypothetical protein [Fluviicola taffensis]AEA45248.1 hypothetical protein Fluta_3276 [Fluviicola taffensis DSM 16823]